MAQIQGLDKPQLTANWQALGDVFYRKEELYCMEWESDVSADLSRFIVAAAAYGGPIAVIRDDSQIQRVQTSVKPTIWIYSAAGRQLASIKWNSGHVIQMGWSCTEDLLCIQEDGSVLVYDMFGNFKRTFSMGQEAKDVKCIDCKVFSSYNGTGIAVMTSTFRIFVINNVEDPRIRRLAEAPGADSPPSSWVILNQDRQTRALVAKDTDLYLLDQGGQFEQQTLPITSDVSSFIEMAVSFNNKYLALFADNGLLWIGSADLQKVYCEFDTKSKVRPLQLCWCGTGGVIGYWENILLMVGPQKDWIKYSYFSPLHLVPEVDGVRILTSDKHEFLQRVPSGIEDVCKIGSMTSGAMLFEATKMFQEGSQEADYYLRSIKDKLSEAVEQCVEAAGHQFEPHVQKMLLRAASFGKCFMTDYRPDTFVNMCKMLRVLNAVRNYTIGIPLTYPQLQQLTLPVLVDRLVLRRHYCLAIKVCHYLNIPETDGTSRILAHWACYKVQQSSIDDDDLAHAIAQKLGDTPGVSYSEIANRAIEKGRTELAIKLLDFEAKAAEQVPLLMKMNKDQLALAKAIESGDTDLVYTVLVHLKETLTQGEFVMAIRHMPVAYALFLQYCREQNQAILRDLFYQEDQHMEVANCGVRDSYEEERIETRLSQLVAAQGAYSKSRNEWAAKQTDDQVKLLRLQRRFEEEMKQPYMNLSLHQTMAHLVKQNQHKQAENLRKEFKVPDRRYWWLKITALGESGDWTELDKFSRSRKSPVGYEPFVEVCLKYHNRFEALKYLPRVSNGSKVKCFVKVGELDQAADFAFQQKSMDDLMFVLQKCGPSHRSLAEKIQTMKSQLAAKK